MSISRLSVKSIRKITLVDVCLFFGLVVFIYALIGAVHQWASPFRQKTEIDLGYVSLIGYSILSLIRVVAAYFLSLVFTLVYGYAAAKSRIGEAVLIPLLDILQSVPVLGFMPGLVLALVNIFPNSNMGLELAAIVMIFTGEGWNMVFSFYSSLKSVPEDLKQVSQVFRLNRFETLRAIELPYATNGLLWNSMLSMAGGWFFLMVIESFSLGDRDFRLPGIGSYMAVAYEQHNYGAIVAGILSMVTLIVLVDRCIWAPLVIWSERFHYNEVPKNQQRKSFVLEFLQRSNALGAFFEIREQVYKKMRKRFESQLSKRRQFAISDETFKRGRHFIRMLAVVCGVLGFIFGVVSMYSLIGDTGIGSWFMLAKDTALTFLRVTGAVMLGSIWTIPLGVFIGTHPKWSDRLQPVVQIVASFPAPMLFPIITAALLRAGISIEFGAMVLMIFASQWYILFNVIAGATQISGPLMEMSELFQIKGWHYWRAIVLPSIFPSLVNGWITAAGGAWNASIVSEFATVGTRSYFATGIGATITRAAAQADYPALAAGILVMVTTVVLINRFFWGSLYRLAETRFRME